MPLLRNMQMQQMHVPQLRLVVGCRGKRGGCHIIYRCEDSAGCERLMHISLIAAESRAR